MGLQEKLNQRKIKLKYAVVIANAMQTGLYFNIKLTLWLYGQ